MPLTDIACKSATCPADKQRARFSDSLGLYLEVLPNGGKYFKLKYRYAGKEKKLSLGVYDAVTLKKARAARDSARALLAEGIDPGHQKKAAKLQRTADAGTEFESVARAWWLQWSAGKSEKHRDETMRRLEADVFPAIGAVPIATITAQQLLTISKTIEKRGAADIARRAYQTSGQILRYAVANGLIERNPAADVRPSDALKPTSKINYARVDAKEVPELLRRIDTYDGSPLTVGALKLMALTFVRTSELIGARWSEIDLKAARWDIPPERMKMKTPHIVPLSRQAVEVLKGLYPLRGLGDLVFPGERDHAKPMSNNTILFALYRMGYHSRMTGHGFRGIASTVLHELDHEHNLIELQLAHQERNEVSAAYNHARFIKQRAKMMQAWADHLDVLRKEKPTAARSAAIAGPEAAATATGP